jgi:hypothetical protein
MLQRKIPTGQDADPFSGGSTGVGTFSDTATFDEGSEKRDDVMKTFSWSCDGGLSLAALGRTPERSDGPPPCPCHVARVIDDQREEPVARGVGRLIAQRSGGEPSPAETARPYETRAR